MLSLALISGATGVNPTAAQGDPRPDLRIRLQFARPGGVFDPARWRYTSDWFVYPSLFNWLVRWKPGTGGRELEPDLAERWIVSPDGLLYTFTLRRGVQFHKGFGELTAEDVVFSFRRQMTDQNMSFYEDVQQIAQIDAVDRYTVRIRLKEPNAAFLSTVIAYRPGLIVSKRAVGQLGDEFAKTPVGTGPFVFERLIGGREVAVAANDAYFRGRPAVKRIAFEHIADELVAVTALIKGEFQVIWTRGNPEAVEFLQKNKDIRSERVVVYDSLRFVSFSRKFAPAQNPTVRKALAHAINRQQIAAAFPGLEQPAEVVRHPQLFGGGLDVARYRYSTDRARALLSEAGYGPSNPLRITMLYQLQQPQDLLAQIVTTNWRAVGVDVRTEPMDATAAFDRFARLDFDVTVTSAGRPADPDLQFSNLFLSTADPPGGSNHIGYRAADDLILRARREQDRAVRERLYRDLHRKIMTDLPIIPLSNQVFVAAWRDPVIGMVHGKNNNFWAETIRVRQ